MAGSQVSDGELSRVPLLAGLSGAEREAVVRVLEPVEVGPGTVLFEEGDPAEGLVLLSRGSVRVTSGRAAGAAELGAGSALGAFSLAGAGTREARAETTSRSRLLLLRREAWQELVADEPRAACRLLEALVAETAALLRHGLDALDGPDVGSVDPPPTSD